MDGVGDWETVQDNVVANDIEVRDGVLNDGDNVIHRRPVILGEGVLASGNDLRADSLAEGNEEDDGEQRLKEALVLPSLLPDLEVGVQLKGSLISLIDADEDVLIVSADDADTGEEALEHLGDVAHVLLRSISLGNDLLGLISLRDVDKLHDLAELLAELLVVTELHGSDSLFDHIEHGISIDLEIIAVHTENIGHLGRVDKSVVVGNDGREVFVGDDGLASGQALDGGGVSSVLDEGTGKEVANGGLLVSAPLGNTLLEGLPADGGGEKCLVLVLDANEKSKHINLLAVRLKHALEDASKLLLGEDTSLLRLDLNAGESELLLSAAEDDLGSGLTDVLTEVEPVLALVGSLSGNDLGADGCVVDDDVLENVVLESGGVGEDFLHSLNLLPVGLDAGGAVSLELLDVTENSGDVLSALGTGKDGFLLAVVVGGLDILHVVLDVGNAGLDAGEVFGVNGAFEEALNDLCPLGSCGESGGGGRSSNGLHDDSLNLLYF